MCRSWSDVSSPTLVHGATTAVRSFGARGRLVLSGHATGQLGGPGFRSRSWLETTPRRRACFRTTTRTLGVATSPRSVGGRVVGSKRWCTTECGALRSCRAIDCFAELAPSNVDGSQPPREALEARISLASLDAADIVAMKLGFEAQRFL